MICYENKISFAQNNFYYTRVEYLGVNYFTFHYFRIFVYSKLTYLIPSLDRVYIDVHPYDFAMFFIRHMIDLKYIK